MNYAISSHLPNCLHITNIELFFFNFVHNIWEICFKLAYLQRKTDYIYKKRVSHRLRRKRGKARVQTHAANLYHPATLPHYTQDTHTLTLLCTVPALPRESLALSDGQYCALAGHKFKSVSEGSSVFLPPFLDLVFIVHTANPPLLLLFHSAESLKS